MYFKMLEWPTRENDGNQISHGTHFFYNRDIGKQ
jgi:hypothetical protein